MKKYDYLIVGAGLFGATCAYELNKRGYKVLVIEKRDHICGNIYTKNVDGINVHVYGAHIFHTSNKDTWDYINQFAKFNNFINSPLANYKGEIYNLPFNMNTFVKIFPNVKTSEDAKRVINEEKQSAYVENPMNLEQQAINLVGTTVYQKLIKCYTEKQWGDKCSNLPPFIIKRIPVRFTFDNNYFNDTYQGIPIGGYTQIIEKMLKGIDVKLNCDYNQHKTEFKADKIIYTGQLDTYFNYCYGPLMYRSVKFETSRLDIKQYQPTAVVNYTSHDVPFTRIIEHKHFEFGNQDFTIISKEYSTKWEKGMEPYYPINDKVNMALYNKYLDLAKKEENLILGGRLGLYQYFDMDDIIEKALALIKEITK